MQFYKKLFQYYIGCFFNFIMKDCALDILHGYQGFHNLERAYFTSKPFFSHSFPMEASSTCANHKSVACVQPLGGVTHVM